MLYDYQRDESGEYIPKALSPGNEFFKWALGDKYAAEPIKIQLAAASSTSPDEFTDTEAKQIGALTELRWLLLHDTKLTDAGLKHFVRLKNLKRLDVEFNAVTAKGAADLQRSLPDLEIYY